MRNLLLLLGMWLKRKLLPAMDIRFFVKFGGTSSIVNK